MENKKVILLIVILILMVLGLGGFIVYDKFYKPKEEAKATITTIDNQSIDLNVLYQVGDILERFDKAFNDQNSDTYFGYIYKSKLLAKDFDKSAALFVSVQDDLVGTNTAQYLVGGEVKNTYENIFGDTLKYKADNLTIGQLYNIVYDASTDRYAYISPTVRTIYSPAYKTQNISTSLTKNSIVVKRKIYYVEYNSNTGGTDITQAILYRDSTKQVKVGTLTLKNGIINEDELMAKYSSKIDTYDYTFKKSSDGTYYFYSIERER